MIDPQALRLAALAELGPHGHALAYDAIEHGSLQVLPATRTWSGSAGRHVAHSVVLELDARRLGAVRNHLPAFDAITDALARAIAKTPLESLDSLQFAWSRSTPQGSPYRGGAPAIEGDLTSAFVAYLEGAGLADLAQRVDAVERTSLGLLVRARGEEAERVPLAGHARLLFGEDEHVSITIA